MTIKAEILLQGGHTVVVETKAVSVDDAAGKFKNELTGGWQVLASRYLIHPGSVAAVRFFDDQMDVDLTAATPRQSSAA